MNIQNVYEIKENYILYPYNIEYKMEKKTV